LSILRSLADEPFGGGPEVGNRQFQERLGVSNTPDVITPDEPVEQNYIEL
jgi:hypothetical protein